LPTNEWLSSCDVIQNNIVPAFKDYIEKLMNKNVYNQHSFKPFIAYLNDHRIKFDELTLNKNHLQYRVITLLHFKNKIMEANGAKNIPKYNEIIDNDMKQAIVDSLIECDITRKMRYIERIHFGDDPAKKKKKREFRRCRARLAKQENMGSFEHLDKGNASPDKIVKLVIDDFAEFDEDTDLPNSLNTNRMDLIIKTFRGYVYHKLNLMYAETLGLPSSTRLIR
jgi:hypothetical protein